jgi:hypothetical protein
MLNEYDAMYRTALNDMIKSNINKIKVNKTRYQILAKAIERISIHIPLLFNKIIKWNLTIEYSIALYRFKHTLDIFWNSQSLYAIVNLGRIYVIIIKQSEYDRMIIINHMPINNNMFKKKFKHIIRAADICGISFNIHKIEGYVQCNISFVLTKCIYICMKTQLIYNFDEKKLKNNKTSDMIDNHIIISIFDDNISESINCLTNSLLLPKHTVKFIPNDISDIFLYTKN